MSAEMIAEMKRINAVAAKNAPKEGMSIRTIGYISTISLTLVGLVTIIISCS